MSKPKKLAQKGAFWDVKKIKIIPRKPVANGAF
jgi:hypothetical protein